MTLICVGSSYIDPYDIVAVVRWNATESTVTYRGGLSITVGCPAQGVYAKVTDYYASQKSGKDVDVVSS